MQDFILLFHGTDGRSLQGDPEAFRAHLMRLAAWMEEIQATGKVISAEPLGTRGSILKAKNGVVTDGPFIESKEMVGGYLRFQAVSLEAATAWAQGCPIFEFEGSCIEIRAIDAVDL